MTEADELIKYFNDFLKWPVLPSQEAQIICAMMDGTINKNGAKEVLRYVIENNLKLHKQFMEMSQQEILDLMDEYGVERR